MTTELSERRQRILKLVVQEFIASASAVASETLVRKYDLNISAATVRNELAALEELGFLKHLHTSGGRVPTDTGYRFFVEHLMERVPLSEAEQQEIRSQLIEVQGELSQWIRLSAAALARHTRNAAVVTPPQAFQARFRHLELIGLTDSTLLIVLVLHDGTVRQQTITTEQSYTQAELRRVSLLLCERCANLSLEQLEDVPLSGTLDARLSELEQRVLAVLVQAMRQYELHINRQIYSDGLIEILSQPEFLPALLKEEDSQRAIERMRHVLETVTRSDALASLIGQALASDDVQVVIGTEHSHDDMRDYSVVLSRYGGHSDVIGVVGIIGPTRMAYPRSISTVQYISTVMSELLQSIYGGGDVRPPEAEG
jgi:heat-inducible transcriptional repressor